MFYRAPTVFYFPDHKTARIWVTAGLSPADEHMLSRALKNCPQRTITREKIGRPALWIVPTSGIIDGIIPDNKALTMTLRCLHILPIQRINLLQFRPPSGATSIISNFLMGRSFSIERLNESMRYRFEMCLKLEGKCTGHLVRNNAHRGETKEDSDLPGPAREFAIHQLKAKHAETTVTLHVRVIDIRPDRANGSLIWVGLKDILACPKKGYCRRIGKMAQVEDAPVFSKGQMLVVSVEVHAAHREFIGDPAIKKYVLKPLTRYLRFVIIQNLEDGEEQPLTLDDFDGPEIEADDD
jgi:hypothetical protein